MVTTNAYILNEHGKSKVQTIDSTKIFTLDAEREKHILVYVMDLLVNNLDNELMFGLFRSVIE